MPSTWHDLLGQYNASRDKNWLDKELVNASSELKDIRGHNILLYASAFLQKGGVDPYTTQLTREDINGIMAALHGMDWKEGLTIILHTPGGDPHAAETLVEYLHSKFEYIEVIVPVLAMSAGTMLSLACDKIVISRPGQLGPIDPQMIRHGGVISARAVINQFKKAKEDIESNTGLAHLWAPILQSLGPSLLEEAERILDYGESCVTEWLKRRMFKKDSDKEEKSKYVAEFFNKDESLKSHGQRIGFDKLKQLGLKVDLLENDQQLQEVTLKLYHLLTIIFEQSAATKIIANHEDKKWVKNFSPPQSPQIVVPAFPQPKQSK